MSGHLTFMMGQFEARLPCDLLYAPNHMWAARGAAAHRFGFTDYAVRLMQDVYFLEWLVAPTVQLEYRQEIGSIESKKAESALYAPMAGELVRLNDDLLDDPSAINSDKYGAGWLFEMRGSDHELLNAEQYLAHLQSVWKVTMRLLRDGNCAHGQCGTCSTCQRHGKSANESTTCEGARE
jgi:glycine cleavage system H protein